MRSFDLVDAARQAAEMIEIVVDGAVVRVRTGQTVAAALLALGERTLRHSRNAGTPRGVYCGVGVCFECMVRVDGVNERACMREVRPGMRIERSKRFGAGTAR